MAIPTLAMIPSGYKLNKVYSVLPTDGSGDLITARTTTARRVNSGGLIEEVAIGVPRLDYTDGSCPSLLLEPSSTNLITQSESFANTYWNKSGASIQGDASTAGAEKATNGNFASSSDWAIVNSDSNATSAIANGYLKLKTSGIFTQASQNMSLVVGNTYKLTYEILSSDGGNLGLINSNNITTLIPSSVGFHTIYFQPNNGTFALKRYSGALDVQIDNVSVKEVSGFSAPSVDSTLGAFKLVEGTSNGAHRISKTALANGASSSTDFTYSIIAKKDDRDFILLKTVINGQSVTVNVWFDLANGVVGTQTNGTGKIESLANGFYRCSASFSTDATATSLNVYAYLAGSDNSENYTGDGTSGVYIFASQLEQKSSATSYIKTSGTTISRTADSASLFNLDTNNIVNDSGAWTVFFELELLSNNSPSDKIALTDSTNTPRVYLYGSSVGVDGSSWTGGTSIPMNTNNKIIYRANSDKNISFFNNGTNLVTMISSDTSIVFNRIILNGANGAFRIKQIQVFNSTLSDSECVTLTTI